MQDRIAERAQVHEPCAPGAVSYLGLRSRIRLNGSRGQSLAPERRARLAVYWLIIASCLAVLDASLSLAAASREFTGAEWAGVRFNLYALGLGVTLSVLAGLVAPAWWRRVVCLLALLPLPVLLLTSRNLPAGLAVLALLVPAGCLGRELAAALLREVDSLTAWAIGGALGLGAIALYGFALGMVGLLRAEAVWAALLAVALALLLTAGRRLRDDIVALTSWLARPGAARRSSCWSGSRSRISGSICSARSPPKPRRTRCGSACRPPPSSPGSGGSPRRTRTLRSRTIRWSVRCSMRWR